MKALLLVVVMAGFAHASPEVERLHITARTVAHDGRCEALPAIEAKIRGLDPAYADTVFAVDPVLQECLPINPQLMIRGLPPSETPVIVAPAPPTAAYVDPGRALWLSLGGTGVALAGVALAVATDNKPLTTLAGLALWVGPTLGHIYAGHTWNTGLAIRLGSAAVAVVGAVMALQCIWECTDSDRQTAEAGTGLALLGAAGYVTGLIYEIATAPAAARDANAEHGWMIAPIAMSHGAGAGLVAHF